ncbi:glycosyltransferase family 4 protein [bacterium]|nr:glycosyltransferase family 4 protein [bacterium]
MSARRFVMAVPFRTNYYNDFGRILDERNLLRLVCLGTRKGLPNVSPDRQVLNPAIGLVSYAGARVLRPYRAEALRFRLHPWFDRWARRHLQPGDSILSSYGYANECFRWARAHGGQTFLDGGNSHPDNFWELVSEEHRRWQCPDPPVSPFHIDRARAMMKQVDYVLAPSSFVAQSFLDRGFRPEQVLPIIYAVDLSCFQPAAIERPHDRPLTIVHTARLTLRKGTPYLLEALRIIHQQVPNARFLLSDLVSDSIRPVLARYADLPIEWAPGLPAPLLAERLRSADLFILPSLEEGLVRTALEALACGLPCILTPNTGVADFIEEGVNGSIVPIRDPQAIATSAFAWWEKIRAGYRPPARAFADKVSFAVLDRMLTGHLQRLGFLGSS